MEHIGTPENADYRRVTVDITDECARMLHDLMTRYPSLNLTERVRTAVELYVHVHEASDQGRILAIMDGSVLHAYLPLEPLQQDSPKPSDLVTRELPVLINDKNAQDLEKLGMREEGQDTLVLDRILTYYVHSMNAINQGYGLVMVDKNKKIVSELVMTVG